MFAIALGHFLYVGVMAGSLMLHDADLLQGRAVTSIACRDTDGLILAAYGPSRLQVFMLC